MTRCKSPFCVVNPDGIRGREFTPSPDAQGVATIWCADCVTVASQMEYFTRITAEMIRGIYHSYRPEDLPVQTSTILTQFTKEILQELKEEL